MQTVATTLQNFTEKLEGISVSPRFDVEILLMHMLGMTRAELKAYPEKKLTRGQSRQFTELLERRLAGEPVAYLVGHQPFWTLDLLVSPDTLIPRPETEHLVEWILQALPSAQLLQLADLGVGSGAIALALAKERPLWQIDATEVSEAALAVAGKNKIKHAISNVQFFQGEWCHPLPHQAYDLIVSNPPYIDPGDPHLSALSYEPRMALVAAEKGLQAIKQIVDQSRKYLKKGGIFVIEHGYDQAEAVQALLQQAGYGEIASHQDYAQHARFATAKWVSV